MRALKCSFRCFMDASVDTGSSWHEIANSNCDERYGFNCRLTKKFYTSGEDLRRVELECVYHLRLVQEQCLIYWYKERLTFWFPEHRDDSGREWIWHSWIRSVCHRASRLRGGLEQRVLAAHSWDKWTLQGQCLQSVLCVHPLIIILSF